MFKLHLFFCGIAAATVFASTGSDSPVFDCFGVGPCGPDQMCCGRGLINPVCVDKATYCRDLDRYCGPPEGYIGETCLDNNGQAADCGPCKPNFSCSLSPLGCILQRPHCGDCPTGEICQYLNRTNPEGAACAADACPPAYPGGPKIHCGLNGDMYGPMYYGVYAPCVTCSPGECGYQPPNAAFFDCVFTNGSIATILGDRGYNLIYCGPCVADSCVMPAPPVNGGIMAPPLSEMVNGRVANGSSVTYSCQAGYKLATAQPARRRCVNGVYVSGAPACVVDYDVPTTVSSYELRLFSDRSCSSTPTLQKSSLPTNTCLANDLVSNPNLARFKFTITSTLQGRATFYKDRACTVETASVDLINGLCREKNTGPTGVVNVRVSW